MKIKKLVTLIILSLSAALAFTSCSDDDGYSLDKFWLEFGTIEKTSDQDYKIILDKGPILFPSVSNVPVRYLENKMRVYADFTILQDANPGSSVDHYVKVNDLQKLLTKPIVPYTEAISDSLGMDPVELPEYWIANDFITFRFFYAGGGETHMVNLTKHKELIEDGKALLEFRHNAYGDPVKESMNSYVSFPLKEIFSEVTDSIQLHIKHKGFDKEKSIDITYRPRK